MFIENPGKLYDTTPTRVELQYKYFFYKYLTPMILKLLQNNSYLVSVQNT
jgi:hypothetical protein